MKRPFLFAMLRVASGCALLASCQEAPGPSAVLDKAIEAYGGAANLSKPRKGVILGTDDSRGSEINQEETFDLPNRWKRVTTMTLEGRKQVSFDVMNEGRLFRWEEGEEPQEVKGPQDVQSYFGAATILLTLRGKDVKLSNLSTVKLGSRTAIGVRANGNFGNGDYFFDQETGLLVQARFVWQPEPGKSFFTTTFYAEHKLVDGVKLPFRRKTYLAKDEQGTDKAVLADLQLKDVRILDKLADDVFLLPRKQ